MGAPAITWFCRNGHIIDDVPHGYIVDKPERCEECGSTELASVTEWQDSDYPGWDRVPHEPIRQEKKRRVVHILVYDVSKLF